MNRILITGSTGFIASEFTKRHKDKFSEIKGLSSTGSNLPVTHLDNRRGDLDDYQTLLEHSTGVDCIVHTAYDRANLTKNITGLKNILRVCAFNKIRRLVFLSTFAVYDPLLKGSLNEMSPYSRLGDPYCRTKQYCEKLLNDEFKSTDLEIIILQPTIVYGIAGNWSAHAVKSLLCGSLYLPDGGNVPCNAVHVSDVADAIWLALNAPLFKEQQKVVPRFLISAERPTTWRSFYESHAHLVNSSFDIRPLNSNNRYSNSLLEETAYRLLFTPPGYFLLKRAAPLLKKMIDKRNPGSAINTVDAKEKPMCQFIPKGINRVYHNMRSIVDVSQAKSRLNYTPSKSIEAFANDLPS